MVAISHNSGNFNMALKRRSNASSTNHPWWLNTWFLISSIIFVWFLIALRAMSSRSTESTTITDPISNMLADFQHPKNVDVLIVGAGPSGLVAAATLQRNNLRVQILEASKQFGGRISVDEGMADHKIDIGPSLIYKKEWLNAIAGKKDLDFSTVPMNKRSKHNGDGDWLFVNYTWHDFLADHVVTPNNLEKQIVYGCQVDKIQYSTTPEIERVQVSCGGRTYTSRSVIVTAPISVLRDGVITFDPPLDKKLVEMHPVSLTPGFKILLEFQWKFYPSYFHPRQHLTEWKFGDAYFWDFSNSNPSTNSSVLAGEMYGYWAESFVTKTDEEIAIETLSFLDSFMEQNYFVSDDMASRNFVRARVINWSKNPFIRGFKTQDFKCDLTLKNPWRYNYCGPQKVGSSLYLAGEAYPGVADNHQVGWIHSAAMSGKKAAQDILINWFDQSKLPKGLNPRKMTFDIS